MPDIRQGQHFQFLVIFLYILLGGGGDGWVGGGGGAGADGAFLIFRVSVAKVFFLM